MWQCPFCETINEDKVCAVCGELRPMPPAKTISQNNQSTNAQESAPDVGLHTESVSLDLTPTLSNSPKKPKKKKTWIWIVTIIVMTILVLSIVAVLALYKINAKSDNTKDEVISVVEKIEEEPTKEKEEESTGENEDKPEETGEEIEEKTPEPSKDVKVSTYITFGKYEQDNNLSNGAEDIEWLVLDKVGDKALVISKYALDGKKYNDVYENTTWAECTLRTWLNDDFYNSAFLESEKSQIEKSFVLNGDNPTYGTDGGVDTYDNVFLLSIEEANKYFDYNNARECQPTSYAVANGVYTSDSGNCNWWLRSPGSYQSNAADVFDFGSVDEYGYCVDDRNGTVNGAVRPAMWITIK